MTRENHEPNRPRTVPSSLMNIIHLGLFVLCTAGISGCDLESDGQPSSESGAAEPQVEASWARDVGLDVAAREVAERDAAPKSGPKFQMRSIRTGAKATERLLTARAELAPEESQRVIVALRDPYRSDSDESSAASAQAQRRVDRRRHDIARRKARVHNLFDGFRGANKVVHDFGSMSLMGVETDLAGLAALSASADVAGLYADRSLRATVDTSQPFTNVGPLHLAGNRGKGTAVVVLDMAPNYWSGAFGDCGAKGSFVANAPDCRIKVWDNTNGWTGDASDLEKDDPHYIAQNEAHGTNVAGIVQAMAPEVDILAFNVFHWNEDEQDYRADYFDVLAAISTLEGHAANFKIAAANLSLGSSVPISGPCNDDVAYEPIRHMWKDLGIMTTVASGNDGFSDRLNFPACVTATVSVAAQFDDTDLDYDKCAGAWPFGGQMACFSNLNGSLDLVAPGVEVAAAGTGELSGTSMAAPHVAGAIAVKQSREMKSNAGELIDPKWIHRKMKLHGRAMRYNGHGWAQLDLTGKPRGGFMAGLTGALREQSYLRIGGSEKPYSRTYPVSGQGGGADGVYLYLEILHPSPEDVEVSLTAPSGTSVRFRLPASARNFNGVLGREHLPGIFEPLRDETRNGGWTLALEDKVEGNRGHFLGATIYLNSSSCTPNCQPNGENECGDDGCGGSCGGCGNGQQCSPVNTCESCTPLTESQCDARGWACGDDGCGGSCGSCDDGKFCNGDESCTRGRACDPGVAPCVEDELSCTITCDEDRDACNVLAADACIIDGVCRQEGEAHPTQPCLKCVPSESQSEWSVSSGSCDDGDPCTEGDQCRRGVCEGEAKDCSGAGDACNVGVCNAQTGACEAEAKAGSCDDGDGCTVNDRCDSGTCLGSPRDCSGLDAACLRGVCNPDSGSCEAEPANENRACDDGNSCSTADMCVAGVCQGMAIDSDEDGTPDCEDGCPDDPAKTAPGDCGCGVVDDQNMDGMADCMDQCPDDPDKSHPGICGCGQPDDDSDGDGTFDCNDQCPNDAAKDEPGSCGCGVPDLDSDSDGVANCIDGCSADPDKVDPGECGCGVSDADDDNDGQADCNDLCPADPDKNKPGVCGCGIADDDSDSDGFADCIDGCPSDPDKQASGECGCGQSDADDDNDGAADCIDLCPQDADKTSPGVCGCGVSDADSDGDGRPDCIDDCDEGQDADNDGVNDCDDRCPADANKSLPGSCGCGFSDRDGDGDGTADCIDGCPHDGNKQKAGVCGCGKSDRDSDLDGSPNCIDACPSDPKKQASGMCGCGVSDDDSDEDGVADCRDSCEDDPDKSLPGACGCGKPDRDGDGDGAYDCQDGCPDDPNKTEPGACGCSRSDDDVDGDGTPDCQDDCPNDGDSDGDGTEDCRDRCPDDPNKTEPGICGCGVRERDSDDDGVPDCEDACPEDPRKDEPGDCGCGQSELDSDGDGRADCADGCPDDRNKIEPGRCGCGRPEGSCGEGSDSGASSASGSGGGEGGEGAEGAGEGEDADSDDTALGDTEAGATPGTPPDIEDGCRTTQAQPATWLMGLFGLLFVARRRRRPTSCL